MPDCVNILSEQMVHFSRAKSIHKIVLTASLETIKARFKERMRGNLPFPVEKMLEAGHGIYDNLDCDMKLDEGYNIDEVLKALKLSI